MGLEFGIQEIDKYDRLVAYGLRDIEHKKVGAIFIPEGHHYLRGHTHDSLIINATIIKSGYATPMTIPPNVKHADLFKKLYEEAREQKKGLWK